MSGCFGNSAEDQYFERQLNRYLDNNVDSDDDSNESNNEPDYDAIDNVDSEESVMKDNHE